METRQKTEIILSPSFYQQEDVVAMGKALLGKYLFTNIENATTGGMIIETESYGGIDDRASHAYGERYTERTKPMYEDGGIAYVYLCYGIHHLLNVVTNKKGIPHAVLIRAIFPTCGLKTMLKRRNKKTIDPSLTSGPGSLSQALGITLRCNGLSFQSKTIWIADKGRIIKKSQIISSKRIGIQYAQEDAIRPWRFFIKNPSESF